MAASHLVTEKSSAELKKRRGFSIGKEGRKGKLLAKNASFQAMTSLGR